ncbi:MAG: carboxypeptidase-like regulatory domain-containing protein, partial [Bacteroidales bacterium]|nr:carboxypeptidase-like regulatory domain-containing protein [Bacteroidales bacterium]
MKLTLFLSFILSFSLLATTYSQNAKMNLDVKTGTIKSVLKLIEEQSNFRFFYNSDLVDLDKVVTGSFSNKNIDEILQSVLSGTSVGYRVLENNFVVLSSAEMLQQITITGTVRDEAGEPMPGVNVMVKGTLTGVVSDSNGKFSINVPNKDAVLSFSFVGYVSREIPVGNQVQIDVAMNEDTRQIEEVVVVG